jgi:signal transduction histidine kinase/CheY-like chemotaxis protein
MKVLGGIMKRIFFLMLASALLVCFAGCVPGSESNDPYVFTTYRDIPGVTEEEIRAIESLRERYDSFVYAMPPSTEAFVDVNGYIGGFSTLFCEWLTELFGIPFNPENRLFSDVLAGLQSGEVDFTGTMTPTEERKAIYYMTDPIAIRTLKYFRLRGSLPLSEIQATRPARFALQEGSSVAAMVISSLEPDTFEVVPIENNSVVYEMLKNGKIDAFIHEGPTESIFDGYNDVITQDFLPVVMSQVSLTAQKPELEPVISIVQKILENDGMRYLIELYSLGSIDYKRHKLYLHLTAEELDYIRRTSVVGFAAEHDNYPVSFYNAHDKAFQGISHDLLNEIEMLTGLRFELLNDRHADWADILLMLKNGEASMVTELIRSPERIGRFLWPETKNLTDYHALLSKTECRDISINEILYTTVGLVKDYAHTEIFTLWFPDHRYTIEYDNYDQAFSALEHGEVDLVMGSKAKLLAQTNFREQPGYKANIVFDYPYESAFGFNMDEAILRSITDKALMLIDTKNTADKWMNRTYDYRVKIAQAQFLWLVGGVVLFLCAAIFFFLSRAKTRAEKESNQKSRFLATMSHEIRTPMNAILGIAQIELQKKGLPSEYADAFDTIYNSGSSLLGIINNILDMSKIENGKFELSSIEYNIPSLVSDTVQLNSIRIGSKPIEFILDIDENLPSKLYGDELRLKQIMNNLLSNAIKYTEKGYVKLSITHFSQEEDVMLRFIVEDTGQGIRSEDMTRLFSEYLRFNTESNRTTEGTGLGLSITKRLVDMMGGTVGAESEYGKGSVFTVTVRQKAVECAPIGAELAGCLRGFTFTQDRQLVDLQITLHPMPYGKVLLVDDVESNLYVAEGLLSQYGLEIETVDSGYGAIGLINDGKTYDMIFMDHMMPVMDGIETTQKLRAFGYTGVIVALTANALTGNDEIFKQKGFDGFISKPIDIRHLNAALNRFIRDRHPEEAKKYTPEITAKIDTSETSHKLFQIFCRDAEKAIVVLRETAESGNIKLFATTAHAIKSALANVEENEASEAAYALENAGINNDMDFIRTNTKAFVKTLEALIKRLRPADNAADCADISEDTAFLTEQLMIINAACENYDDTTVYTALGRLKEKPWKPETSAALEHIRDTLFLHSDFEGAGELVETLLAVRR